MEALQVMEDANKIIEDFSLTEYWVYFLIFSIEIALAFWVGIIL